MLEILDLILSVSAAHQCFYILIWKTWTAVHAIIMPLLTPYADTSMEN